MKEDIYKDIILFEFMLLIIACGFIYNEIYKYKEEPQFDGQVQVAEHQEQGYQIYQCPSGTIVIKFDEEENNE